MPKGRHKGATRRFTNFKAEELKSEKEEKRLAWRAQRGEIDSDDESGSGSSSSSGESGSGSSSEEEEDTKERKPKGVSGLIQFENPNHVNAPKEKKAKDVNVDKASAPQVTRRQKEEMAKQRYEAMHAAGKTDQARADMERLTIIRQKRAEAERRKKEDADAKATIAKAGAAKAKK